MSQSRPFASCLALSLCLLGAASTDAVTLLPPGYGMMHVYPELGAPPALHSDHITVGYQKTTDVNRQIQRAFVEFALDAEPVASAQLELEFFAGADGTFELYVGDEAADLAISVDDFDRSVTLLAAFDPVLDGTLLPDDHRLMRFDVSGQVAAFAGSNLGFQVRLQGDLARTDFTILGAQISGARDPHGLPRLLLQPIPEPASSALLALGLLALGAAPARRRACR